ncbi:site-specific integrase [Hyphomicrobium sp. D-2]|uniref:site-specific integrase n=1 Tax=Hyphomicrobium sp. D-2 TaxID=3041621 RepID=UPI002457F45B|nr:site-specific integrase [Hyphomicrobium sp. D-2]MDH4982790.1 site-specific integrase [Hyphomicrobium sp. D-2]
MGVVKNRHGTYVVRKKVPKGLEEAVARVLGDERQRVAWLQRSLGTKDLKIANVAAKPILIEFDAVLAKAAALVSPIPQRDDLSDGEVKTMADYFYASLLSEDDEVRRDGAGSQQLFREVADQVSGVVVASAFDLDEAAPPYGMSEREFDKHKSTVDFLLPAARKALARGDLSFVDDELDELMAVFRIGLDPSSKAYRALGTAVLKRYVQHLEALDRRNAGEVVETPPLLEPPLSASERPASSASSAKDTLSAAYEGWKKARSSVASTDREYYNAIQRFIELHGDMRIRDIRRSHVREYREAVQMIPTNRAGPLRKAKLPELVKWSEAHPAAKRLGPASVNKLLGGGQAICNWAYDNGFIPDDRIWADPFAKMRVDEPEPDPVLWDTARLKLLFNSSVFTQGDRPEGGGGEGAYWMPLLALFTGARQGELAALTADDVETDEPTGIRYFRITNDEERGARVKNKSSRRVVPVHPELKRLGFLTYVDARRRLGGQKAPLFPLMEKGPRDGFAERWSKWFGRYLTKLGIKGTDAPVFHSFRHGFKDALRWKAESEDVNDALTGHSGGGVGRRYGARDSARRFGMERLADAVAKVEYPGLSLEHLYPSVDAAENG